MTDKLTKQFFEQTGKIRHKKQEAVIPIDKEGFESVSQRMINHFKVITNRVCTHTSVGGRTTVIVLFDGLVEVHELRAKDCTYVCFQTTSARYFNKYKQLNI